MYYIYKITNLINGKVYIGLTTLTVEQRWKIHVRDSKTNTKHLYKSIRKYGIDNFYVEKIDETDSFKELGELERKYIKEYQSTDPNKGYNLTAGGESNQLDGNPRARLTVDDVIQIRTLYSENKIGVNECWGMYKDKISYSAFEKIFEGATWKSIMPEVYTEENKKIHKQMAGRRCKGEKNVNSILSDDDVMEIRKYYVDHTLRECYEKYGKGKFSSKNSFRFIIDKSYAHLPMYSKKHKKWVNNFVL